MRLFHNFVGEIKYGLSFIKTVTRKSLSYKVFLNYPFEKGLIRKGVLIQSHI